MDLEKYQDYVSRGISLMSEGQFSAAKNEFKLAVKTNPREFEGYIHLGNACASDAEYEEAISAFKNALVVNPKSGEALFSIANVYLLKDDRLKAIEYYNKAEEVGYTSSDLYQIMAGIFLDANDMVQALRNIGKAINVDPLNGELRVFKAKIYITMNKFDEALETLDEMEKILPDALDVYDLKSQIYCGLGKIEKALQISEKGYQKFPNDPRMSLTKLNVLVTTGKKEEAKKFIQKMKDDGTYNKVPKEASIQEMTILLQDNDVENAISILLKADKSTEGDPDILYLLMDIYGMAGNYEQIVSTANRLIGMDISEHYISSSRYYRADALVHLGKEEEAKKEFRDLSGYLRKVTIQNPAFYEGYLYRTLCHTHLEEYKEALDIADYVESLFPGRADADALRYFIYKKQGDEIKAEEAKKNALAIDPNMKL